MNAPTLPLPEVSAEDHEEIIQEIAEELSEELKELLRDSLKEGFLVFTKQKPADRLAGYMKGTIPAELEMLMDPEYVQKSRMGAYPLPYQSCNAQAIDLMSGQQGFCMQPLGHADPLIIEAHTPDRPQPFINFWALIAQLPWWPDWSPWEHFMDDFSRLLSAEVSKLSRGVM